MTEIVDLLRETTILPRSRAISSKAILSDLAELAANESDLDARRVFDAVLAREKLASTGVGEGVAIPHARLEGLDRMVGAFARLETPVDFDAIDNQPCDLIFMLLAPEGAGADHLRALAKVSRVMRQEGLRKDLRTAQTVEALWKAFTLPRKPSIGVAS